MVLVSIVRLPLPLPVGAQLSEKGAPVVAPAVTVTVWGFALVTLQFPAIPERATVWLPAATPVNVTVPLLAIGWLAPPSTVTV